MSSPSQDLTPSQQQDLAASGSLVDWKHLLWVLRERWLGALALAALVCSITGFVLLRQPFVYTAQGSLLVERSNDRVMDIKQVVDTSVDGSLTDAFVLTHLEQIRSHSFLAAFSSGLTPQQRAAALATVPAPEPDYDSEPVTEEDRLERYLLKNLTAERNGRTLLITLSVRHQVPAQAQFLVNRIAEGYISYLISRSTERNSAATSFLTAQAEELRSKVERCESELQAYRETHNLISLEDNQNIVAARVRDLSTALTQARVGTLNLSSRVEQAAKIVAAGGDPLQLARVTEFLNLTQVQKDIDELKTKRAVLGERYGPLHPNMQDNASAIEALTKVLREQTEIAISDLRNQLAKAKAQESRLQEELGLAEKESLNMAQLSVRYNVLRREVDTTRTLYTQVLARQNETAISSQLQNTNIKFVDRAGLPTKPTDPNRLKIALILVLLAGAIGLGYPLGADMLDQRIKLWSDVENYLKLPLLAEIGTLKKVPDDQRDQIVIKDLDERTVEGFRALYSHLHLSSKTDFPKTMLITSTVPGEGKSFVASNLAGTFAAHGKRVLLVDCDFRRPSLHKGFGLDNKTGTLTWLEAYKKGESTIGLDPRLGIVEIAPNISLLRTGGVSHKASEMLETPALTGLLEALQSQFDLLILDTPPAGLFPDAEAFSSVADELVFVCRFAKVGRPQAAQVLARLRKTKLIHAGAVLNAMPDEKSKSYYYSTYSYRDYAAYYSKKED
jgi:capsular exopolysaccharide synthesis family protein